MYILPLALVVIVLFIVNGLRTESDSVLDRLDPRIWPFIHH